MSAQRRSGPLAEPDLTGSAVLDDKSRIALPKPLRDALGLRAGSAVAYVRLHDMILLIPQDAQSAALLDRASASLEAAGITSEDFLANVPAARSAVVNDAYGEGYMQELSRRYGPSQDDVSEPAP